VKVYGNFTCARCGRPVPYVHSATPTVDVSTGRITCFACSAAEKSEVQTGALRAISLYQPWASLVAVGAKSIETRSWSTPYRGQLAIHASKTFSLEDRQLVYKQPFAAALVRGLLGKLPADAYLSWRQLPTGALVAVANLHRVGRIGRRRRDDEDDAVTIQGRDLPVTGDELEFGNYAEGRYGWVLTNVQRLKEPIPCRGALSVWAVPPDVEARIREQVTL